MEDFRDTLIYLIIIVFVIGLGYISIAEDNVMLKLIASFALVLLITLLYDEYKHRGD